MRQQEIYNLKRLPIYTNTREICRIVECEKGYNASNRGEVVKIAMFGHKRVPSREGGIEIVVEELSARMVRDGYEVVCYNRRDHHVGYV